MDAVIDVQQLTKRYGHVMALSGLSLRMERGEVFGLLGPNGAGKTTAVKVLLGLARATGGSGSVLGAPLGDRRARARIGYLPELFRYPHWLSAAEVLALHARLAGLPATERPQQLERCLTAVHLQERGHDRVGGFSKGMQQRLGLAVALTGNPDLVVLDEPTSALDPEGRHDVRGIIQELSSAGTSVLLNSHLLSEVEQVCQRVAVMNHGVVIASGTMAAVIGDSPGVRLRVTSLADSVLAAFGTVQHEAEWTVVRGVSGEAIADLVAAAVAAGGRVTAVEPLHRSLEQRFLELVGGQ